MTKCYMKSQHPSTKIRRSKQHRFTCVCRLIHLKQKARREQLAALDARASPPRTEQIPFPARVRAPLPAAAPHGRDASPPGAPDHRNGGELTLFPLLAHIPRTPAPVDPICESDAFFRAWGGAASGRIRPGGSSDGRGGALPRGCSVFSREKEATEARRPQAIDPCE
jgi:hypothetical protein